jgi:hypothetical protein
MFCSANGNIGGIIARELSASCGTAIVNADRPG